MKRIGLIILMVLTAGLSSKARILMPQLFQSGMVLQRGKVVPVWGKADPGEKVVVSWQKRQLTVMADTDGRWRTDLPKMKAGGPYEMRISSYIVAADGKSETQTSEVVLTDVLVGDVWLCSGQSNIDVTIERVYPQYTQEIDQLSNNRVRLFRVQNETSTHGVKDDIRPTSINWKPLNRQNAWLFSAVGTFLGQRMALKTGVPQGIIVNSWGGTPIEAWIIQDSLQQDYPMMVKKTALYQNDLFVKAQMQANSEASRRWDEMLNKADHTNLFIQPSYQDDEWNTINQYDWNWNGTGSVWLRQHIYIDKQHAGKPARLLLGTLFDQDITYLNGKEIGHTYYQYPPRRYDIPEGLLQEGDNVIAVRFINKYGAAHFIPEKPYMLCFGEDRLSQVPLPKDIIPLGATWKCHVGAEMPSCPNGDVSLQNLPTTLYNAVLHPLAPFAISGIVWYQGESNTGNPTPYADLLQKMMGCWRTLWQDPQMPFCIVQLANYDGRQQTGFPKPITPQTEPANSNWALLREAQRTIAKRDDHAELAVINDLGETVDIHPLRKKEVAERIGRCMDRLVYHESVLLSPEVVAVNIQETRQEIIVHLDQPVWAGQIEEVELCDNKGVFHNVHTRAEGKQLIVTMEGIKQPTRLRYAWKDNPIRANIRSKNELPMSSFELKLP